MIEFRSITKEYKKGIKVADTILKEYPKNGSKRSMSCSKQ